MPTVAPRAETDEATAGRTPVPVAGLVRTATPDPHPAPARNQHTVMRSVIRRSLDSNAQSAVQERWKGVIAGRKTLQAMFDDEFPGVVMAFYSADDANQHIEKYVMPSLLAVQALIDEPEKQLWGKTDKQLDPILTAAGFKTVPYRGSSLAFTWERQLGGSKASFTVNFGGGIHDQGRIQKASASSKVEGEVGSGGGSKEPLEPFYYKIEFKPHLKLPIKVVGKNYTDPRTEGWDIRRV